MNTVKLANQAGIGDWWDSGNENRDDFNEVLEAFRALIVAERDKELIDLGVKPAIFFRCQNCTHEYMDAPPSSCDCSLHHYPFDEINYYTAEHLAAARLQDQQRIAELEANLKRATVALKAHPQQTRIFRTALQAGLKAGDGKPCSNNHDPDCRWPLCNCRK